MGIYKRKQESKKTKKQELDQESDQENKKTRKKARTRPESDKEKKEKNFPLFQGFKSISMNVYHSREGPRAGKKQEKRWVTLCLLNLRETCPPSNYS